jgi:hypothetical protein
MGDLSKYDFGGLDREPTNLLRLISELEGSYQLLKYMGFEEDMEIIDKMKKKYYTIYFEEKRKGK